MAFFEINNVCLRGIASCVPKKVENNTDYAGFCDGEAERFIASTGVEQRRLVEGNTCTSDLCYHAAERLMQDLNWSKDEINCLVFVSQTPDYQLPATACILQERLQLNSECLALDISLGCSGWIYGLNVVASMLSASGLTKGLVLSGDTSSCRCSKNDKSTYPLFGDAGTATALEFNNDKKLKFHAATDGSGWEAIIIPDGGARNPITQDSFLVKTTDPKIERNNLQLRLEGMDVFSFGISKAPQSVNGLLQYFKLDKDQIDYFLFHQANLFMNENIRKKLKLSKEKVPYSLNNFGNTSSASIPLTITTQLKDKLYDSPKRIVACGFGVGLSWGSVYFETEEFVCSDLIEI